MLLNFSWAICVCFFPKETHNMAKNHSPELHQFIQVGSSVVSTARLLCLCLCHTIKIFNDL